MKTQRLLGRLAAACLFVSVVAPAASAQVRRDAYGSPKASSPARPSAPVRSTAPARPAASPSSSYSTSASSPIRFGVRAGLNLADVQGDAVQSFLGLTDYAPEGTITKQMRPGFHAGLYATIPLGSSFAIEPGLSYSEKGTVLQGRIPIPEISFLNARATGTARLGYIDVPVLAKAYITPGFYLFAGPQASFLVSGKARLEAGALGFDVYQQDFDIKSSLRPLDFAVVGGVGYQFENGLGLSAGYDYGLSSLDKNNRFNAQNQIIKASASFSF
ncbi:hypothetical protein GCM10023185_09530 [Hymenobacter saemangeumensis]|uniref:Outer membrane protein beta-barrel domain-containing protein n=1 Tax=Hymenobacter saemangeumensis TaxID=1084522 RepID=A0ABP8I4B8_9BACT